MGWKTCHHKALIVKPTAWTDVVALTGLGWSVFRRQRVPSKNVAAGFDLAGTVKEADEKARSRPAFPL
jgi:hypothetical protein